MELVNRESRSSWSDFLRGLKARGLNGVELVVSDDHAGLKAAIREVLPEAVWQRCYVHFLRNALDYVPRQVDDDCLQELRWLYARRDLTEARRKCCNFENGDGGRRERKLAARSQAARWNGWSMN